MMMISLPMQQQDANNYALQSECNAPLQPYNVYTHRYHHRQQQHNDDDDVHIESPVTTKTNIDKRTNINQSKHHYYHHQKQEQRHSGFNHQPIISAALIQAQTHHSRSHRLLKIQQFQHSTKLRVAQRQNQKRCVQRQRQNTVRQNFERYLQCTRANMKKFNIQNVHNVDRVQQTKLQREHHRIVSLNTIARRSLLSFKQSCQISCEPIEVVQNDATHRMSVLSKHSIETSLSSETKLKQIKPAFWDVGLEPTARLSRQEEIQLAFRLRKCEMYEERQRARTEAMIRKAKKTRCAADNMSNRKKPISFMPSNRDDNDDDGDDDDDDKSLSVSGEVLVVRHNAIGELPLPLSREQRIKQYGDMIRYQNRHRQVGAKTRVHQSQSHYCR